MTFNSLSIRPKEFVYKQVSPYERAVFKVKSEKHGSVEYTVDMIEWECNCPDHVTRKKEKFACKHIFWCLLFISYSVIDELHKQERPHRHD